MPNGWPSENLYNILTIAEDIHLRFCCMLQSKEGLAELSTVNAYECFSLHASLLGWVIMISDMKPNPFHSYFYLQYVQAFTKTSYLLFLRPVMETKYIRSSTLMVFLNRYNIQERFGKILINGNLHAPFGNHYCKPWHPFSTCCKYTVRF